MKRSVLFILSLLIFETLSAANKGANVFLPVYKQQKVKTIKNILSKFLENKYTSIDALSCNINEFFENSPKKSIKIKCLNKFFRDNKSFTKLNDKDIDFIVLQLRHSQNAFAFLNRGVEDRERYIRYFLKSYNNFKKYGSVVKGKGKSIARKFYVAFAPQTYFMLHKELSERLTMGMGAMFSPFYSNFPFYAMDIGADVGALYFSGKDAFEGTLLIVSLLPYAKYNFYMKSIYRFYGKLSIGMSYLSLDNKVTNEKLTSMDLTVLVALGSRIKLMRQLYVNIEAGYLFFKETVSAYGIKASLGIEYQV